MYIPAFSNATRTKGWELFEISILNGELKSTSKEKKYGAIISNRLSNQKPAITEKIANFNGKVYTVKNDTYPESIDEYTAKKLVFKDGKLLLETDIIENSNNNLGEDSKDNNQNDSNKDNSNEQNNNEINLGEDITKPSGEINAEKSQNETVANSTKLPQTGAETNAFVGYLSTAIILGLVWLGSMLLIDREKKKMSKR